MKIIKDSTGRRAILLIAANYIIAEDVLKNAKLSEDEYLDIIGKITENSISLAEIVSGEKGIIRLGDIIEKYKTIRNDK